MYRQWELSPCRRETDGVMADRPTLSLLVAHSSQPPHSLINVDLDRLHRTTVVETIRVISVKGKNYSKKGDQDAALVSV